MTEESAMRYATARPDESFSELAARLFDAETRAELQAAKRALEEANPHVAGRRKLEPGTVVEVPELDEAVPTASVRPPSDVAPAVALNGLRAVLPGFSDAIRSAVDERAAGADREARSLRSDRTKRAARQDKGVAKSVREARAGADYRLAESRALRAEHKAALPDIESDLQDLLRLFGA
jgi:hypothetical protein